MQLFQIKADILGGIKDEIIIAKNDEIIAKNDQIIAKNDQIIDRLDQSVRPEHDVRTVLIIYECAPTDDSERRGERDVRSL